MKISKKGIIMGNAETTDYELFKSNAVRNIPAIINQIFSGRIHSACF